MRRTFTPLFVLLLLAVTTGLYAQQAAETALSHLRKEYTSFGLEAADVDELSVTDDYRSPGGTHHVYVRQQLHGLPILNAQASLHYRGGRLVHRTNGLVTGLASVTPMAPAFSAQIAVGKAVAAVTAAFGTPVATGTDGEDLTFSWAAVSPEAIRVTRAYYADDKAGIRPVYRVLIDRHATSSDIWYVVLDAETGDVLRRDNQVLKCDFGAPNHRHNYDNACANATTAALPVGERMLESAVAVEDSRYHVFPFGEESPIHGERVMVESPDDAVASPFGWHDTNGVEGPEYTTTRGNNVWSYPDRDADNEPDDDANIADGGDSLVYDFYYADNVNADTLLAAAMAQTFYFTNTLHDWLYHAGFDEAAGNFQRKNYTDDGEDRDEVRLEVQDGSGFNNANFSTPTDGSNGRMQMFLWTADTRLTVEAPADIAGDYQIGNGLFGVFDPGDYTGKVAYTEPELACTDVTNDLGGRVALITRGECNFSLKTFNAQQAGAIAVIICNDAALGEDRGGTINMSNGNPELDITIPSVFLSKENCAELRAAVLNGEDVTATVAAPGPRDGDFDNGIVAHELGHGLSTRLVGGPNRANCLFNDEQMGEGWSDFLTLASSPRTNDDNPDGTEPRGIGNYATNRGVLGRGIRNQVYSTDMSLNNHTYDHVITSGGAPHPLGEVWNTMLWDLYWAMVEDHGFDEDLYTGTGGNNIAVQLVVEGLKRTKCNPGFVDGRDGIIAADRDINNGENVCRIYEVFARRGVGASARQGSGNDRTDNREAFDVNPFCAGGVQLTKTADVRTINAGESITFTLKATSYREEDVTNVTVTDVLPAGLTLDPATIVGTDDFTIDGQTITFNIGDMSFEDDETVRYTATSDATLGSTEMFYDGAEEGDDNWELVSLTGDNIWFQTDTLPFAGDMAWYIVNASTAEDQTLQTFEAVPVPDNQPVLRFFTKYDTEAAWDAGLLEVSTDGENWDRVPEKLVRGDYRGDLDYRSTLPIQDAQSWWGNSEAEPDAVRRGYREMIFDLGEFAGDEIFFRWRFVSDAEARVRGWWIDEIQLLEAVTYDGVATLTSDAGDDFEARVADYGVLALNAVIDNTVDPALGLTTVNVFPNPAEDFVNVSVNSERAGDATVQLLSIDGRVLQTVALSLNPGRNRTVLNTAALPAGLYVVQVAGANRVSTQKVTVN